MNEADIRAILRERVLIAKDIFGWSDHRVSGFLSEIEKQKHEPGRTQKYVDPQDFNLTEDHIMSPGHERLMPYEVRRALGRYDAVNAFASWDMAIPDAPDTKRMLNQAFDYVDRCEMDHADLEGVTFRSDFNVSDMADRFAEASHIHELKIARNWLLAEHNASLDCGGSGYAHLILERIRTPCVYVQHKGGPVEIADGWHRTAAAISAGQESIAAIIVPLAAREFEPEIENMRSP